MEADRMGHLLPALTQEKLDNQREVVRNERRQNYEMRPTRSPKSNLGGDSTPRPPLPSPDHWKSRRSPGCALDDVKDFFREWYGPNNATLVVVGDFDPAQTKAWIEKFFGGIQRLK